LEPGCKINRRQPLIWSLLCHSGLKLRRKIDMDFVRQSYLLRTTDPVDGDFCLIDASDMQFRTQDGSTLGVSHPLLKSAYLCLGRAWPRALTFDELLEEASRRLDPPSTGMPAQEDIQILVEAMYVLACSGEVSFQVSRPSLTTMISDRPLASLLARKQSESDTLVTNLLHQSVRLEDEKACRILQLLDGRRTFDELVTEIGRQRSFEESVAQVPSQAVDPEAASANLGRFLSTASKLGLLIS
jgi:hypothetical protein